ncbi:hypothetical protein I3760_14G085300 [Carya illinoinensis]|nr:hypothetical protein I3760_14G085300 [Carya illinoinensis]
MADALGGRGEMPSNPNPTGGLPNISSTQDTLKELNDQIGKQKSLAPIVKMLEDVLKALKTLEDKK